MKEKKKMSPEEICKILEKKISDLSTELQEVMELIADLKDQLPKAKPEGEPEELTEILGKRAFYVLQNEVPTIGISKASSICYEVCKNIPRLSEGREVTIRDLCSVWKSASGHFYSVGKSTEEVIYSYLRETLKIPEEYFK